MKNADGLTALQTGVAGNGAGVVRGCVTTDEDSMLSSAKLSHPGIVASDNDNDMFSDLLTSHLSLDALLEFTDKTASSLPWGYFNSTTALQHAEVLRLAELSSRHLSITQDDNVCISITLCHAFGIASACAGTLLQGAAVVLPAVGGIQGCGVPSQRAAATLDILASEKCTLLFADTHTLKALPPPTPTLDLSALRGGIVKVGSGSDIMPDTVQYGGVTLSTMSKLTA